MADACLVILVVGAPEGGELAEEIGAFVGELCRTHPINGFRPGLLADLHQLVADPADGFIPGDPLPLAVDQLERIFESAITVHELAHAGALDAMRARSEEQTSELPSLMRITYAVFCLKNHIHT